MLDYSEIKPRKRILKDTEPYEVISSHVFRKQQRKPVNQTKLKHLITGKVVEHSFHQSDKVEEADIDKRDIKYLYNNRGEWWFCDPDDPKDRFQLPEETLGDDARFLKENTIAEGMVFNDEIIGIKLPVKMQFAVTEAPPNIKGNTVSGSGKIVTLETGAQINTPMFIETGEIIEVNTETGEYTQRVTE